MLYRCLVLLNRAVIKVFPSWSLKESAAVINLRNPPVLVVFNPFLKLKVACWLYCSSWLKKPAAGDMYL